MLAKKDRVGQSVRNAPQWHPRIREEWSAEIRKRTAILRDRLTLLVVVAILGFASPWLVDAGIGDIVGMRKLNWISIAENDRGSMAMVSSLFYMKAIATPRYRRAQK